MMMVKGKMRCLFIQHSMGCWDERVVIWPGESHKEVGLAIGLIGWTCEWKRHGGYNDNEFMTEAR